MDFAANAVVDVITPPPRAGAAKSTVAPSNEPTFDDHLEAAAPADEAEENPAPDEAGAADAGANETVEAIESPEAQAVTALQPEPTAAAPVLVQLIASIGPLAGRPVPAEAPVVTTPVEAPEGPQAAPANDATAPAPTNGAEKAAAAAGEPKAALPSSAKGETVEKPAPAAATPQTQPGPNARTVANDAAPVTQRGAAPQPVTPGQAAPSAEQATQIVTTAASPAGNASRDASRAPKSEPHGGEFKIDAPAREGSAPSPQPAANKSNTAKAEPVAANEKDSAPVVPQSAAPSINAAASQTLAPATTATQAMAHTQHASLEQTVARAVPAAAQVAREIVRRYDGENTRFELRLDPPELGRVEVRLDVSRDHRVTAVVSADSPQALTELARHARELEQTLQSAGLELADNGLSFDLRQGREGSGNADEAGSTSAGKGGEDAPQEPVVAARPIGLERWRGVRVDVMV